MDDNKTDDLVSIVDLESSKLFLALVCDLFIP